jgi:hypothetical protein
MFLPFLGPLPPLMPPLLVALNPQKCHFLQEMLRDVGLGA